MPDSRRKPPEILNQKTIAKTSVFTIQQMQLRFANGNEVTFERIHSLSKGAVLIVAQPNPQTILLIREYCAGVQRYEIAFPKGRVEQGESILESANREMMEELGYGANSLECIKSLSVSPGYMSHQTHVIYATDLYPHQLPGDEPETIEILQWPVDKISDLLQNEAFTEARSIAALYLLKDRIVALK